MAKQGSDVVRLTAHVTGYVQGVGFRWSTLAVAQNNGLVGFAENQMDGSVLIVAEGPRSQCQRLLDWLRGTGTRTVRRPGRVESVTATWSAPTEEFRRFSAH